MDSSKVDQFLTHLLTLPGIQKEPIIVAESIIINFIKENYNKLLKTFNSPSFFPGVSPNEVIKILFNLLYKKVDKELKPFIDNILEKEISFDFINILDPDINTALFKKNFKNFILSVFSDINVRLNFKSIYYIFKTKAIDRYIIKSLERKQAVYNELFRIQKVPFKKNEDIINYIKFVTILSIKIYNKVPISKDTNNKNLKRVSIVDYKTTKDKIEFINILINRLGEKFPFFNNIEINKHILQSSFYSNFQESVIPKFNGVARIINVFLNRYKEFVPYNKIDRGAETPDKSWYSIALKNYKFMGINQNIVNEFYLIAGDNLW